MSFAPFPDSHMTIQTATCYPTYACAAHVAKVLNGDDATLDGGWSYPVVEHLNGWAVGVVDEDGHFLGKL